MRDVIEPTDSDRGEAPEPESETLGRLLTLAGPRQAAPVSVVAEVKRATYPAWQAKVRAVRTRRRRRTWMLAAAASLVIAGALWRLAPRTLPDAEPPVRVATVEVTAGAVTAGAASVTIGARLDAGSTLETDPRSHATLRLAGGASARLDAGSVLKLEAADALELERGAVYLDTGRGPGGASLAVSTRYGVARDVGTQFEVRLLEDALKIQVREGSVEIDVGEATHEAVAGSALTVAGGGAVTRETVPAHGPSWGWVLGTSPPFELEGRTLGEFLDWVTRETGWRTRFADPALESEVTGTAAHGSIAGVRPDLAPDVVLPSYGLRYRLEDGILVIV